jgi:hypothetical protein
MTNTYEDALRKVSDDMKARNRASDDLLRAFMRVRTDLEPSGWVLMHTPAPPATDHLLVGFAMHRDGRDVAQCVFKVGPARLVQFDGMGEPMGFAGSVDDMGEAGFHRLLENWAGTVQAVGAQSLKHHLFKAEDGARFIGRVDAIEDGLWRATCHAMLDQDGATLIEQPDSQVFTTKADGRAWIMNRGARRGFATWVNEAPDEGHASA